MDDLVHRVVERFQREAARWDNAMNGTFVSIYWNKQKWRVEESDTPISGMRSFTEAQDLDTYEMPTLERELAGNEQERLTTITTSTIREYAKIHSEDKGPVAREKIIKGYGAVFDALVKQWKEDGNTEKVGKFEKLLPTLRKKLVWKKVHGAKTAAAANIYADDLDVGYIAQQVVLSGKSRNWAKPEGHTLKIAADIEKELAPFNIGIIDEATGTWGHKPGGSHFYR